ncbi:Arabinose operon regulatory protein [Fundidesulfovibrio magnetotacticus]|uniref:Arabinose operon regulatory protein n=1 Tax=Fundidesulfovibrio magnetotacticus TaxID=2730080 RepID=A0A6V8M500_9BACT|nr:AraC family transcriptional regulator [Fundidesulfovibrio magnetotacticus]GFK95575.1 Arabinose operon regulatory protein [Fundidesulfovibrio magnetotacticus]
MPTRPGSRNDFLRDPSLPFLESRESSINGRPFGLHAHDTYSVSVVEGGSTFLQCRDAMWLAGPGSAVFLPPGEPHACNPQPGGPLRYHKHYIDRAWLEDRLPGLPRALDHRQPAILDDPALARAFARFHRSPPGEHRLPLLLLALERLFAGHHATPVQGGKPRAQRRAALQAARILASRPAERIPLAQLATSCGVSPCHLPRIFRETHATTPHAYANQLRVDLAKQLLSQGKPIAEVAAEAGFADQSHLNRVFRRYAGATPREYQGR